MANPLTMIKLENVTKAYKGDVVALREANVEIAPSNLAFDESLRSRDPDWGLRDRDAVIAAAREHGLAFTLRKAMPANNLMLLFRAWP